MRLDVLLLYMQEHYNSFEKVMVLAYANITNVATYSEYRPGRS